MDQKYREEEYGCACERKQDRGIGECSDVSIYWKYQYIAFDIIDIYLYDISVYIAPFALAIRTWIGRNLRVIRWQNCICSRWHVHTTRWQRRFDSSSFFFVSFTLSKNPPRTIRRSRIVEVDLVSYPKIVEADAISQKFQMRFELQIAIESRNDYATITNRDWVVFWIASVNGLIDKFFDI